MQEQAQQFKIGPRWRAVLALMLGALVLLTGAVGASDVVVTFDRAAGALARAGWLAELRGVSRDVSALAGSDLILPLTAVAVAVLALVRHWHGVLTLSVAVLATQGVVELLKSAVERPRPAANEVIAEAAGHSFPSAHSATAVALYATLALLAARYCRGGVRVAVLVAGGVVILAVGFSRVQLGAHYPVDVVAGWLTGAVLVLASWAVAGRVARLRPLARASY